MGTAITFDTFKYINRLKEAGVSEKQAIAEAEALSEAIGSTDVVTKKDLQIESANIRAEVAAVKAEINLLKWMVGLSLALSVGIISMLSKLFALPAVH